MKKAICKTTVKIRGVLYLKGGEYRPPYPKGFDKEIETGTGTIVEIENDQQPASKSPAKESAKEKKLRLEKEIMERFGVQVDRRESVAKIEAQLAELEQQAEEAGGESTNTSGQSANHNSDDADKNTGNNESPEDLNDI